MSQLCRDLAVQHALCSLTAECAVNAKLSQSFDSQRACHRLGLLAVMQCGRYLQNKVALACRQLAELRDPLVADDVEHAGVLNRARFSEAFKAAGAPPRDRSGFALAAPRLYCLSHHDLGQACMAYSGLPAARVARRRSLKRMLARACVTT